MPVPKTISGGHLVAFDTVGSTNDEAIRLARQGADDRTVVWAREETAARGGNGTTWIAPRGNLYCSFIIRDRHGKSRSTIDRQAMFITAVAIANCIRAFIPPSVCISLKYPNDVLLDDRKVAGVLIERSDLSVEQDEWMIVGIGINVETFPENVAYPATALKAVGCEKVGVVDVLESCYRHFFAWYDRWSNEGFAPIRSHWLSLAKGLGKPVEVHMATVKLSGRYDGIDDEGVFLLHSATGEPEQIHSVGKVFFQADEP